MSISQHTWHYTTADALDNFIPPISASNNNNLLQPINANNNNNPQQQHDSLSAAINTSTTTNATQNVGATWSDNLNAGHLKIDLDNLLNSKANKLNAPAPSMNALKTQSPTKQPGGSNNNLPLTGQITNFNAFGAGSGISPLTSPTSLGGGGVSMSGNFFGTAQQNIPSQLPTATATGTAATTTTQMFANFSAMNLTQQQKSVPPNNNNNNNNNSQLQVFDIFQ
ncbi:dual specificity protein kinase shkD-like [Eurosta solidaginis]|uniref:dual specificity protein kinase shkD-like n=1 Tax=Eurosta solidaginis TaxID=178769 RepID=UPI00353171C7